MWLLNATHILLDQIADGGGELAAHQQIRDQLDGVLPFLGRRLKEQFSETGTVDCVAREMRPHRHVLHRGLQLLLHLQPHLFHARTDHIDPVGRHVRLLVLT